MRRFDHEMGEHLDDLLDLSRADVTSRRPGRRQEAIAATSTRSRSASWPSAPSTRACPPLPPGLGNAIMETFGLPPSKRIGDLRKLCEEAVERGELEERRDAAYYVEFLRDQSDSREGGLSAAPPRTLREEPPGAPSVPVARRLRAARPFPSGRQVALPAAQGADLGDEKAEQPIDRDHDGDRAPRAA